MPAPRSTTTRVADGSAAPIGGQRAPRRGVWALRVLGPVERDRGDGLAVGSGPADADSPGLEQCGVDQVLGDGQDAFLDLPRVAPPRPRSVVPDSLRMRCTKP